MNGSTLLHSILWFLWRLCCARKALLSNRNARMDSKNSNWNSRVFLTLSPELEQTVNIFKWIGSIELYKSGIFSKFKIGRHIFSCLFWNGLQWSKRSSAVILVIRNKDRSKYCLFIIRPRKSINRKICGIFRIWRIMCMYARKRNEAGVYKT